MKRSWIASSCQRVNADCALFPEPDVVQLVWHAAKPPRARDAAGEGHSVLNGETAMCLQLVYQGVARLLTEGVPQIAAPRNLLFENMDRLRCAADQSIRPREVMRDNLVQHHLGRLVCGMTQSFERRHCTLHVAG